MKGQRLEVDPQVDAFHLYAGRHFHLERAKLRMAVVIPAAAKASQTVWAFFGGDADDADVDVVLLDDLAEAGGVEEGDGLARCAADYFFRIGVDDADDVEAVVVEASVVAQGHAEVAGAGDDERCGRC
jgi:hypothetical protein